ncbi:MAG: NAD(P)-dependent oxidoreductase [Aquificota bacterium]|jgi:precorrin-2 dehydrogenase/sirohydrochlorin ferrochelatase
MPLFPLFVDLKGKEILVVGGGKIATRKVEKLLPFGGKITVVAPKISPELKKLSKEGKIKIKRRSFLTGDLKNKDLVVAVCINKRLHYHGDPKLILDPKRWRPTI